MGVPGHRDCRQARYDGHDLRAMFASATALFEANSASVNALNVFPVPDGDTGTNMLLTMREVMRAAGGVTDRSVAVMAGAMARGALSGARGNSGVILYGFFKGLAAGLDGGADFGPAEFAAALGEAREASYRAVGKPVEGTVLTVIDRVSRAAREKAAAGAHMGELCEAICAAAREAVALTPTMLPVLRDAGVVDAGGQGLSVILEGVRRSAVGEVVAAAELPAPEPVGVDRRSGAVSLEFLEATGEERFGYCTQFMIQGEGLDPDVIRGDLEALGKSTVVVGDETMVKVHLHALDPGPALSYAVSSGTLAQVKIDNMDEQHAEFSAARRGGGAAGVAAAPPISVVAVAWGGGLERLFRSLGAAAVMAGGNTMNPSVREIVEAVDRSPSETVIFLPNNRNIVPAASQAAQVASRRLEVVPTRTIPQGVAAILAFSPQRSLESNIMEMEKAVSSVRTGEVTRAVRPATLGGLTVGEGQAIGLLEGTLVEAGDEPNGVLLALVARAEVADGNLVTLYWGASTSGEEAADAAEQIGAAFPGVEVEVVEGGQPHYHYIVSIE